MEDCLFCRIVRRDIPADIVFEDEVVVAFRDVNPQAPTHVLVIPKEHIKDVTEVGPGHASVLAAAAAAANEVARQDGIAESGYRLVWNVGPDAGQSVFHLHLHVLGGRPMAWPPG